MAVHAPPPASQRCHWRVTAGVAVQLPSAAVSVWVTFAVPDSVGSAVLVGAATRSSVRPESSTAAHRSGELHDTAVTTAPDGSPVSCSAQVAGDASGVVEKAVKPARPVP